jgi:hypothetical protein
MPYDDEEHRTRGCPNGRQRADTKRTHQKRHARRLTTHPRRLGRCDLQEKTVSGVIARVRACTRATLSTSMVRRGSTVRVRQRALPSRRTARKWPVPCCRVRHRGAPPSQRRGSIVIEGGIDPFKRRVRAGLVTERPVGRAFGDRFWGRNRPRRLAVHGHENRVQPTRSGLWKSAAKAERRLEELADLQPVVGMDPFMEP